MSVISQFSRWVVSDSLRPHESKHTRPPCPSQTPRVYSNSCPSSWWCHPAISSSVVPFSFCPQSLLASGFFPMSQLLARGSQSIGVSASASVLPMNSQDSWGKIGEVPSIPWWTRGWLRRMANKIPESDECLEASERLLLNHAKTLGFLASGGEEFNPGPEMRLDLSEFLCNKVLLKYKGDRESFWHRHQKGVEEYPLASLSTGIIYSQISYYSKSKECLEVVKISPDLLPWFTFWDNTISQKVFSETVLKQDALLLNNPKECRGGKSLSFLPPWEFQTPLSMGTPRLLINLPRNWLSH